MTLVLASCLNDPESLWSELQTHWRQGELVGLAPPQDQPQLAAAVLGDDGRDRVMADGAGQVGSFHTPETGHRLEAIPEQAAPAAGADSTPPGPDWRESSWGPALVLGSGGSSGGRRWCLQPLSHLEASAHACGTWLSRQGIDPGACLHLNALPLHHVSGLMPLIRSRQWGAALRWLPPELMRTPELLARDSPLPGGRPVLLSLVPTQLHRLLASPEAVDWLRRCTLIWVGGAPLSAELAARARRAHLPMAPCYGATETAAMVCALPPQRFLAGAEGCGAPLHDVELALEGDSGAVAVRTARVSPGWFEAGRLHPFIDTEGWWRSGDAGSWGPRSPGTDSGVLTQRQPATGATGGPDRSLLIHGRLDGAIHSGGETVFPEQVRQRLLDLILQAGLPVIELLVLGEPDLPWGERLVALVRWDGQRLAASDHAEEAQLLRRLAKLAETLAPSQRPRQWLPCPMLTSSDSGKWQLARWREWLRSQSPQRD